MSIVLSKATISDVTVDGKGAEFTNRLLPDHQSDMSEMEEHGKIGYMPVTIYYMLDADDCAQDDISNVDYAAKVDRIEIDLSRCDNEGIGTADIVLLISRLG